MYISKLYINNYKSIKEETFYFEKGINVLVGKNSAGKSNIVCAIDEVLGDRTNKLFDEKIFYKGIDGVESKEILIYTKLEEIDENLDFSMIDKIKRKTACIDVTAYGNEFWNSDFIKEDGDFLKERYGISMEYWSNEQLKNVLSNATSICLYKYVNRETETNTYSMIVISHGRFYRIMFVNPNIRATLINSLIIPAFRSPENMLKINEWTWYGKLLRSEWAKCCNEEYQREIARTSKNLSEVIEKIYGELKTDLNSQLKKTLSLMKVEIALNMIENDKEDYYKEVRLSVNDGIETKIENKGSGLQSLIIIELFKFYCKIFNKFSALIIEEPELFLHPQARKMLADILHDFVEGDNFGNQIILTTHSNEFVQNIDIDKINIVKKESGETKVYHIDKSKYDKRELQKIKVELQYKNTEMFFAEKVILVEGEEVILIPNIVKKIYGKNILNNNDISVIKVGGKSYFHIYRKILEDLHIKNYIIADYDIITKGLEVLLEDEDKSNLNQIKSNIKMIIKKDRDIDTNCRDWSSLEQIVSEMISKREYNKDIELIWDNFKNRIYKKQKLLEFEPENRECVEKFIESLYCKDIFIMKKGELEDYYKKENFGEEYHSLPKGLIPYKIVEDTYENIDKYMYLEEYKKILEYVFDD